MGLTLSADEVLEVATATRKLAKTLTPEDALAPAEVVPAALAALAQQPSVPGADAVVTVHTGAREVVTATLKGVQTDLLRFANLLEDSVDSVHDSERRIERAFSVQLALPVGETSLNGIGNGDGPTEAEANRQQAIEGRG